MKGIEFIMENKKSAKKFIIIAVIVVVAAAAVIISQVKPGGGSEPSPSAAPTQTAETEVNNGENDTAEESTENNSENNDKSEKTDKSDKSEKSDKKTEKKTEEKSEKNDTASQPEETFTPTFMYFVSDKDENKAETEKIVEELKKEYEGKVNFDVRNIDENPEDATNFPVEGNTPALIMLNTSNDICAFEMQCADKDDLKQAIEGALGN